MTKQHSDLYPDAVEVECLRCGNVTVMSSAPRSLAEDSGGAGAEASWRPVGGADYAKWVVDHAADCDIPNTEVGLAAAVIRLEEQLEAMDESLRTILDVTEGWTRKMTDAEKLARIDTVAKAGLPKVSSPAEIQQRVETTMSLKDTYPASGFIGGSAETSETSSPATPLGGASPLDDPTDTVRDL